MYLLFIMQRRTSPKCGCSQYPMLIQSFWFLQSNEYYICCLNKMISNSNSLTFIPFVSFNSFGKLILNAHAVEIIKTLSPPISIATIVGPRCSGKSFLLKQIATPYNQGFTSSAHHHTEGLFILNKPHLAYNQEGKISSTFFIDSPGFGNQQSDHQDKFLALIFLLSNCILYNTCTPFSSALTEEIQNVNKILKQIQSGQSSNPAFHWILRDYFSQDQNHSTSSQLPKLQFENFLSSFNNSSKDDRFNVLRDYFPTRECHYLINPFSEQSQINPLFLQQTIELRKKINYLPSLNIDGVAFIELIQTYIESINNGESVQKLYCQGCDCLLRMQCVDKFNGDLRMLEQQQSINTVDEMDQRVAEVRLTTTQYYMQGMKSIKQIKRLEEELNVIFQEFQRINEIRFRSCNKIIDTSHYSYLQVPQPEKMMRVSLNVSECDRERSDGQFNRSFISLNRISDSKSLYSKLQEFQTKIVRFQLENEAAKKQVQFYKNQLANVKGQLELKSDELEAMQVNSKQSETAYKVKISELQEMLSEQRKQKVLEVSQKQKLLTLSNAKIEYLENEISQISRTIEEQRKQRQEKYRSKINEYLTQITELKQSHQQEVAQLKCIYKANTERFSEASNGKVTNNFYKDFTDQLTVIENLSAENQKYKYHILQLQNSNKFLSEKLGLTEEKNKESLQHANKKQKEIENHYESLLALRMHEKETMISQLQQKIASSTSNWEAKSQNYQQYFLDLRSELSQAKNQLNSKIATFDELSSMIINLKAMICKLEVENDETNVVKSQKHQRCISLQYEIDKLNKEIASNHNEFSHLKIVLQRFQSESQIEREKFKSDLTVEKEQKENIMSVKKDQISAMKLIFKSEKKEFESKIAILNSEMQQFMLIKYELEQTKQALMENQQEFNQKIEHQQRSIKMMKDQLEQLEHLIETKDQHIAFLNTSITALNRHLSEQSTQYLSYPPSRQTLPYFGAQESFTQLTKLQTNHSLLQHQYSKQKNIWVQKQEEYKKQMSQLGVRLDASKQHLKVQSQNYQQRIITLQRQKSQIQSKLVVMNQKINYIQTKNVLEIEQKISLINKLQTIAENTKNSYIEQTSKPNEQLIALQRKINLLQKERSCSNQNIEVLQRKLAAQKQKSETYICLFEQKMRDIKNDNERLYTLLHQYCSDHQYLKKSKILVQNNFEKHMALSELKFTQSAKQL